MNISCRIANTDTQCGRITNPPERNPNKTDNIKIFNYLMNHPTWNKTTDTYKQSLIRYKQFFLGE